MRLALILLGLGIAGTVAEGQGQIFGELHRMLPADADGTCDVALGDVDGDGDIDALLGNDQYPDGKQNRLYLNDGFGGFSDATANLPLDSDATLAVVLGDVDGDGDLDALTGNTYPGYQNRLYLNDSAGVFTDATANLPVDSDPTYSIALGDVDGDWDLDVLIGNGGQNLLYLNDGFGVFIDATINLPADSDFTQAVALGDVDGDGDLDALVGNSGSPDGKQNRLYLNDGAGAFTDATINLPVDTDKTQAVTLGDVDGDLDLDALIGNLYSGRNSLYLNDGSGVFVDASATLPVTDSTYGLALGDVDGDLDLDALIGVYGESHLFLNDGSGLFADATDNLDLVDATHSVALGDVDGDLDLDAMIANGVQNRLHLNDGSGSFTDVTDDFPTSSSYTTGVSVGDVDGDLDLDVLIGRYYNNRLYLNDGNGLFTEATGNLPVSTELTEAVSLGDVDGDGDLDAMIGNGWTCGCSCYGTKNLLYLNDGTGVFYDASVNLPPDVDTTYDIVTADIDGDGDLDALIGNGFGFEDTGWYTGGENRLYLNDGAGVFSDASVNLPYEKDLTYDTALGDVDGDGDLDAVIGDYGGQKHLYLNDGSGVFADASANMPPGSDATTSLALGDVDGDQDLDVLIGNSASGYVVEQNRLYLNDGTGVFTDATANLPAHIDPTYAVVLGDVDGDLDLDAVIGNAGQNRLYLNDGAGVFADATGRMPAELAGTLAVALEDVDADLDLDLLLGNYGQDRLHANLTRQAAWRGFPRVGQPLAMDLHGTPGTLWYLGFSSGTADIPFPPYGTLKLDPSGLAIAGSGSLDAGGFASLQYQIPDLASLVGVTRYWQALIGSPVLASNLETTTLTGL